MNNAITDFIDTFPVAERQYGFIVSEFERRDMRRGLLELRWHNSVIYLYFLAAGMTPFSCEQELVIARDYRICRPIAEAVIRRDYRKRAQPRFERCGPGSSWPVHWPSFEDEAFSMLYWIIEPSLCCAMHNLESESPRQPVHGLFFDDTFVSNCEKNFHMSFLDMITVLRRSLP
jgi:hypothetical protein